MGCLETRLFTIPALIITDTAFCSEAAGCWCLVALLSRCSAASMRNPQQQASRQLARLLLLWASQSAPLHCPAASDSARSCCPQWLGPARAPAGSTDPPAASHAERAWGRSAPAPVARPAATQRRQAVGHSPGEVALVPVGCGRPPALRSVTGGS